MVGSKCGLRPHGVPPRGALRCGGWVLLDSVSVCVFVGGTWRGGCYRCGTETGYFYWRDCHPGSCQLFLPLCSQALLVIFCLFACIYHIFLFCCYTVSPMYYFAPALFYHCIALYLLLYPFLCLLLIFLAQVCALFLKCLCPALCPMVKGAL